MQSDIKFVVLCFSVVTMICAYWFKSTYAEVSQMQQVTQAMTQIEIKKLEAVNRAKVMKGKK